MGFPGLIFDIELVDAPEILRFDVFEMLRLFVVLGPIFFVLVEFVDQVIFARFVCILFEVLHYFFLIINLLELQIFSLRLTLLWFGGSFPLLSL